MKRFTLSIMLPDWNSSFWAMVLLAGFLLVFAPTAMADSHKLAGKAEETAIDQNPQQPAARTASPDSFQITRFSINAGGAINDSSASYRLSLSVGQPVIGAAWSASYQMSTGFWYAAPCAAKPGDANATNSYSLGDIIATVNYIFNKPGCTPTPLCWLSGLACRGDWNGSSTVTLGDVIQGVNFIFNKPGGPWTPVASGFCCQPL